MSQEGPKLYTNKPKKAQLKQFQDQKLKAFASPTPPSSQSAAAESYKMGSQSTSPPPPPPPPQATKESFLKRNKFLVPLVLTVNLAVGAYLFMRTKKKDIGIEGEPENKTTSLSSSATPNKPVATTPTPMPAVVEPVKLRDPIPENQQRELLKWILEEKRKLKPKDSDEKKRIDDEKDILKRLIRAKSIPTI